MDYVPHLIKIFSLSTLSFILAMVLTPVVTYFLFKYKFWKRPQKISSLTHEKTPIYTKLQAKKHKRNIPTAAGLLITFVVFIITIPFNLSRSQTWLPLFALVSFTGLGFIDDFINVRGIGKFITGIKARHKILIITLLSLVGALWFYYKLGWNYIHIPGIGDFTIGPWYIPFFMLVIVAAANAVDFADGLDGLAGGVLASSFAAFAGIALVRGQFGIAAFCGTIMGALLAFLWFNIYPARFFMGDTGSLALGATLEVIAMLTNSALVLPIIGVVFVGEAASVIIQILSKKFRHKKVFLSTPIHYHFQAKGWPETKVTMRFWIIGAVFAVVGLIIGIVGRG